MLRNVKKIFSPSIWTFVVSFFLSIINFITSVFETEKLYLTKYNIIIMVSILIIIYTLTIIINIYKLINEKDKLINEKDEIINEKDKLINEKDEIIQELLNTKETKENKLLDEINTYIASLENKKLEHDWGIFVNNQKLYNYDDLQIERTFKLFFNERGHAKIQINFFCEYDRRIK